MAIFEMVEVEIGQFTDADTGLEKGFNNCRCAQIFAASVAQGAVFGFGQYSGGFVFVFWVFDGFRGVVIDMAAVFEEAEETFN